MALGIDIYRSFQHVTSWPEVRDRGVTFVYVKLSDGGGKPTGGTGDAEVAGARSVGIPVGGYHFVQANPGPEAQADILLGEVRRLGATGCVPMLDLEDNPASSRLPNIPDSQKRAFATRFLNRVAAAGFRPGVYLNNALAKALRPDTWGVPGLVIWIARYGARPDPAAGRYDIHQYSSTGSIPGITAGGVDLDESYTNAHLTALDPVTEAPDMDANQDQLLREIHVELTGASSPIYPANNYVSLRAMTSGLTTAVSQLTGLVSKQGGASAQDIAAALLPALSPVVQAALADAGSESPDEIARAVSDRLGTLLTRTGQ